MREIRLFHVGIKAFLARRGRLLLVRERMEPRWWELPGGRIDVGEEALRPEEILRREIAEELGRGFRFRIGRPVAAWTRPPSPTRRHPVFLVGFRCAPSGGAIRLSEEHDDYRWADRRSWRELRLAPGYARVIAAFFSASSRRG